MAAFTSATVSVSRHMADARLLSMFFSTMRWRWGASAGQGFSGRLRGVGLPSVLKLQRTSLERETCRRSRLAWARPPGPHTTIGCRKPSTVVKSLLGTWGEIRTPEASRILRGAASAMQKAAQKKMHCETPVACTHPTHPQPRAHALSTANTVQWCEFLPQQGHMRSTPALPRSLSLPKKRLGEIAFHRRRQLGRRAMFLHIHC